jgi:hypothetical protein
MIMPRKGFQGELVFSAVPLPVDLGFATDGQVKVLLPFIGTRFNESGRFCGPIPANLIVANIGGSLGGNDRDNRC